MIVAFIAQKNRKRSKRFSNLLFVCVIIKAEPIIVHCGTGCVFVFGTIDEAHGINGGSE